MQNLVALFKPFEGQRRSILNIDWVLFLSVVLVSLSGLVTMNSFVGESYFFGRQTIWLSISIIIFFVCSFIDWRFLRRTGVVVSLFVFSTLLLLLLMIVGEAVKGAQSWFQLGTFAFQPSDPVKLTLIIILSKYFSRRHIEIAHVRHIVVSGVYAFILFVLVFLQPDFGSSIILFAIWLGMVLVSGISKRHLLAVVLLAAISFGILWSFVFEDYQKQRIVTFIHPLTDIQGAGYNAYQSTIAVGSGQIFGKGVGYGTQSKLRFLPEYETDFIFAAFAEEWGFVGVTILLTLYGVVLSRILQIAIRGASNFETFFGLGVAILFISHIIIHIGMNIGLLPVTGTTIPFMSYGGSHLVTEFAALGILMGQRKYSRPTHAEAGKNELVGVN
ncbi:MAG: rod shape-determining protein RodA [Candidatus Zambryskibacteria bacterium RIFCSPHIGHO2_12_FULL_44_12b]|uniref:Rod shape-determining protein RodA n=1 Tax=Candidatus Zambryskibacteria bacterium RIFCSPLOWO2_01_FULL_45_21 TaxID=1802761 RepID=A0A1G2TZX2_9BACT|nr:MAG: rod shape-determining protein RodA [Candidatus Zambryskibacteria bacterium RIFCSPHIGHO2_12_FULL_44_12b]OHB02855.1 MAG: rod shape-determining protein RodA [Candidatus Zambryskibacteria bacterium RIFCSPLOWO2_01_FULL_45_21]